MSRVTCDVSRVKRRVSRVATPAPHQPQPSKMQTTMPQKHHTSQASHVTSITRHKHHMSQASHVSSITRHKHHTSQASHVSSITRHKHHTSQASHVTSITRHKHHTSQASHVTSTASLQRRHQPTRVRSTAHHNPWPQSVTLLQCYSDTVLQFVTVLQCGTVLQCYSVTLSQHHNAAKKQQRTFARAVSQCRNIYVYIYICIYIYIYIHIYIYKQQRTSSGLCLARQ